MKILMITDVYFPRINGVSTSIQAFRNALEQRGHEVHLIAPDYGSLTGDEHRITRIPARPVPFDPEDRLMQSGAVRKMTEQLRQESFDIIHIQTPFLAHRLGIELARSLRIPVVESYHTFFEEYFYHYIPLVPKSATRFLARWFSRRQCNELDGVIVPSTAMLEVLQNYGVVTPTQIIPTGLALDNFVPSDGAAFRAKFGIAADRPTVLFVGRTAFEKNIDFLLRVTAKIKQSLSGILFVVAGEGPALEGLKSQAASLGIADNVNFVGYLERSHALRACYRGSDVFIFASRTETQGLVLLEAMAQGIPVVSTAFMGTRDILVEGKGALIADEDVDDFAAKTLSLLQNKSLCGEIGEAGRGYALKEWSMDAVAERVLNFYWQTAAQREAQLSPAATI
ncbi:MAG: glycosyltransferase [Burkholderiales bacterium]